MQRLVALLLLAAAPVFVSCAPRRPITPESQLIAQGVQRRSELRDELVGDTRSMLLRVAQETGADRTIDILVLSGGGDYGAFGAAFLRAWRERSGEGAMPEFDIVSGVSTGALIAPFAFLGSPDDLAHCENLYRNPKPDWVKTRGILGLLPDNASLAEVPGLERDLRASVDLDFTKRIADQGGRGRMLLVNTTDLDQGRAQPFELTRAARQAIADGTLDRFHNILLASSGIPGVFPPREIDGTLFADGGITSNILYGAPANYEDTLFYRFKQAFPAQPGLHMRYWVIFNNQVHSPPHTVQRGWLAVLARSVEVAIRASTMTSLRHLYSHADSMTVRGDGKMEVRWVAIPDDWRAPAEGVFAEETMRDLADIGARLGADPAAWNSKPPDS
jgi:Patatin-like phospholipase